MMTLDEQNAEDDGKSEPADSNKSVSTPNPTGSFGDRTSPFSPRGSVGRIKVPPVCRAESLVKESLSGDQLSKMCWSASPFGVSSTSDTHPDGSSDVSKQSSSVVPSSRLSSKGAKVQTSPSMTLDAARSTVVRRMTSRTGRETQRWATDASTNQLFRLVTGTVPIMNDGRILVCSSSKGHEWILPKGGWEADETMEESASRETFEEAGILGTLGPKLEEVEYETRKAKKRRLEWEERMKKAKKKVEQQNGDTIVGATRQKAVMPPPQPLSSAVVSVQSHSSYGASSEDEHLTHTTVLEDTRNDCGRSSSPSMAISSEELNKDAAEQSAFHVASSAGPDSISVALQTGKMRNTSSAHSDTGYPNNDDTASVASAASGVSEASASCAHVRMSLFPLYVSEVRDEWPESGRVRKVIEIDAAIKMMEPRPEFQAVLLEVKRKGLHKLSPLDSDEIERQRDKHDCHQNGTNASENDSLARLKDQN
mmetsp:Transcript_26110/g.48665  ORF Transcript_26110/g.48665 Transcript_26110/m.48665 type:complete len:481 (-) Transcript_26110:27-1469(-)